METLRHPSSCNASERFLMKLTPLREIDRILIDKGVYASARDPRRLFYIEEVRAAETFRCAINVRGVAKMLGMKEDELHEYLNALDLRKITAKWMTPQIPGWSSYALFAK
jgi:hypothetical protein